MNEKGKIIIVSGPSASGSSTVIDLLVTKYKNYELAKTAITRAPRLYEETDTDYVFLSNDEFEEKISKNEFLEYEKYAEFYYGTLKKPIYDRIKKSINVVVRTDIESAIKVKKNCPEAILVFIMPPDITSTLNNLISRGSEDEAIRHRFSVYEKNAYSALKADILLVNNDSAQTAYELTTIIERPQTADSVYDKNVETVIKFKKNIKRHLDNVQRKSTNFDGKSYVFISYSTVNQSEAIALKEILNSQGINTWIAPDDIPAGDGYSRVIVKAIKNCSCLVLLLSPAAQTSKWVPREVERAVNYGKKIIPIQIEKVELNEEFELYIGKLQSTAVADINLNDIEIKNALKSISTCIRYSYTDFLEKGSDNQIGEIVLLGKYQQSYSSGLFETPLEWIVIAKEDNKLLLISRRCIDVKVFDQSINSFQQSTPWRDCSLRKWLNSYFFEHAFSIKEKEYILASKISNDGNEESCIGGTEDTVDSVFLLSTTEVRRFLTNKKERIGYGTEFANEQYMNEDNSQGLRWWLRSPGYYDYRASIVCENGKIDCDGFSVNRNGVAVRPAIWVKIK